MEILTLGMGSASRSILMDKERHINNALLFFEQESFHLSGLSSHYSINI